MCTFVVSQDKIKSKKAILTAIIAQDFDIYPPSSAINLAFSYVKT